MFIPGTAVQQQPRHQFVINSTGQMIPVSIAPDGVMYHSVSHLLENFETTNSNNVAYLSQQIYKSSEPPPPYSRTNMSEESPTDVEYSSLIA